MEIQSYWDLNDILTEDEKITIKTLEEIRYNAFIDYKQLYTESEHI
jgi:hypothetical protein